VTDRTHDRPEVVEGLAERDPEARARALQSLLIEQGLLSTDAIDAVISRYETEVGPMNGARVVARAWTDEGYRERLLADATGAISELGIEADADVVEIRAVANSADTHNVVVCTLCSCYPWTVLGLAPTWYKSPEYRSRIIREPRAMLSEVFDLALDDSIGIDVWDSTSEVRYMVVPQRPPGTEGLDEEDLAERVTRDSMIGVERLAP
jgi:nitrile hydratase subunit alpha